MPPPVRVRPDFPCMPGSAFGVEDHLEDCLVQGLEQLLVQPLARALQMEDGDTGAGCGSSIPIVRHCPHSSASVVAYPGRPFENTNRKTNSTTTSVFSTRRHRCQCRSAAPASSFSSADTGKRPSASCLPPMHLPCVPSSGQCTASWPHGSRSPAGTSPDPQRSPPVPAPGRAGSCQSPCSRRTAIASTGPSRPDTESEPKGESGTGSCSPPPSDASPDPASQSRRHDRAAGACPPQTADSPACDPDDPAASSARNSRTDAGNPAHDAVSIRSFHSSTASSSATTSRVPVASAPSTRTLWRSPDPSGSYAAVSDLRFPFSIPAASPAATRCRRTPAAPASADRTPVDPDPSARTSPETAQGVSQLMAAQSRKHFHRLLNVRNPTAGQPRATKGGRLQLLDSGIHHVGTRDHLTKRRLS